MKDHISKYYDEITKRDALRPALYKAWGVIEKSGFKIRLVTMPVRIKVVIAAHGIRRVWIS